MLAAFIYRRACVPLDRLNCLANAATFLLFFLRAFSSCLWAFLLLSSLFSLHVLHRACMQVKKNLSDLRSFGLLRHGMLLSHGTYPVSSRFLASKNMSIVWAKDSENQHDTLYVCMFLRCSSSLNVTATPQNPAQELTL